MVSESGGGGEEERKVKCVKCDFGLFLFNQTYCVGECSLQGNYRNNPVGECCEGKGRE